MTTLRRPTSGKLVCFAHKNIIFMTYEMCNHNRKYESQEIEMLTLRRSTSGKLMCFANENIIVRTYPMGNN